MDPRPARPEPDGPGGRPSGPPPAPVRAAVVLVWLSIGLTVLGALLTFASLDELVDQALQDRPGLSRGDVRSGTVGGLVLGVVLGGGLSALLALFMARGARWARTVWTVVAVLGLVLSVPALGNQPALTLVLQLVGLAITVSVLVLLHRPESNRFFARPA